MSPPFVSQIIWFESPFYKQNPEILGSFIKAAKASEDNVGIYTGFQVEDPNVAVWVSLWKSVEAHDAFASNQDDFSTVAKTTSAPRVTFIRLIDTAEDFLKAVNAPVTEIGEARPKPEHVDKLDQLGALMTELNGILRTSKGNVGVCQGKNAKDDGVYTFTVGWATVEDHNEAIKEGTKAGDLIGQITGMADVLILKHGALSPA